jgi:hypothetical protein
MRQAQAFMVTIALLFIWAAGAQAAPIPINSTGATIAPGVQDPNWEIFFYTGGTWVSLGQAWVVISNGYPGSWVANDSNSKWIAPNANYDGQSWIDAVGDYRFETTFDLTGLIPGTAHISGEWSTDNQGLNILLNGVDTGVPPVNDEQAYKSMHPFDITSGFVAGVNYLDVVVHNQDCPGCTNGLNPVGDRVTFSTAEAQLVPEPAAFALLGVGLVAVAAIGRRKKGR